MSGQLTVKKALDVIKGPLKSRGQGYDDLKHVLRYNQQNPGAATLDDTSYLSMYHDLFEVILSEQSTWLNAKAATTQSAADTRLSNAATALRLGVELGIRSISEDTVRAVIDHVTQTLRHTGGGVCMPIALDYVKCLRAVFSYQPHVEHLKKKEWEHAVHFCVHTIRESEDSHDADGTRPGAERISRIGMTNSLSHRSSRSQFAESAGSQATRTVTKQVSDELISCLSLLTGAPSVSLGSTAHAVLWTLLDFLKGHPVPGNGHQNAFTAINNILFWARTDDTALVKKATSQLVRLVQHFWLPKGTLKDEMLVTLLYLRPYMVQLMQHEQELTLRPELAGLTETLRAEYGKRGERDQLQVDEVRLAPFTKQCSGSARIQSAVMELRPTGLRAEHNWALVSVLATLSTLLPRDEHERTSSEDDGDEDDVKQRPRKRQRLADDYEDLLYATVSGTPISRLSCLQVIAFVAQERPLSAKRLAKTIDRLTLGCSEENASLASWAMLALASCASQRSSTTGALSGRWASVWQLVCRSMTNASTCRAACHLLDIMLHLQLVAQASVVELMHCITTSMELSGPPIIADSSLHFLCAILKTSQQVNPGTASVLAEGVLAWLCRRYAPSRFEDKGHASMYHHARPDDVVQLVNACLNHQIFSATGECYPLWNDIAQVLVKCQDQQLLVSYLLLLPEDEAAVHPKLAQTRYASGSNSSGGSLTGETLLLNQIIPELHKTLEAWDQWQRERPSSVSSDMFGYLCHVCCTFSSIAYCNAFRDVRRQSQLQRQLDELLAAVCGFAASYKCSQMLVDVMLLTMSNQFAGLSSVQEDGHTTQYDAPSAERLLCRHVSSAMLRRQSDKEFVGQIDEDDMDMDHDYDSQDSRRGKAALVSDESTNDSKVTFSAVALRANLSLYAFAVAKVEGAQRPTSAQRSSPASAITDYLLSLPMNHLVASRSSLTVLPRLGISLSVKDAERLLEHCTVNILSDYVHQRSEVSQGTLLALMSSLRAVLTDASNENLFNLGMDIYDSYVTAGKLSVDVRQHLGAFLLQLCEIDTDYGRNSDVQSARTSLFKLVQVRSIRVQYFLANRISSILGLFVLSAHDQIFNDLQASLPEEADWLEGLAMRLLFLARLASAWHSLLRQCVYYIFETAGRVKEAASYAACCVGQLTTALKFTSARRLFRLFAPQLLHTWLEHDPLAGLPYEAFQYASLDDLIEHNQGEITAQLLMRGKENGLHIVSKALKISEKELTRRCFPQVLAYAICCDIRAPSASEGTTCEGRARALVGGKEELKILAASNFAAVMGYFFLAMQHEDVQDKWLEKKPAYANAAKALQETKNYSQSTRTLPASQQPSFKSNFLPDQIERLTRRTPRDPAQPWDPSSFALAARMLLDSIDGALGPLHMCLVLRRLRILICMAGDVALTGFPLEMLVHFIRPFLSESQCADDALGMLQYLLHHGLPYLKAENDMFVNGTICVMILQMQVHSAAKQESTTQDTQHQQTVQKMGAFQAWLVKYLRQCQSSRAKQNAGGYSALATALDAVRLPGNARQGTAESALLMVLLEQQGFSEAVMSEAHCAEALRLLAKDFEVPASSGENCMERDEDCIKYADSLWRFVRSSSLDSGFLVWAAGVMGRAYASTGSRPLLAGETEKMSASDGKLYSGIAKSQAKIARRVAGLMLSHDRAQAGLADWTIRTITYGFTEPADALAFEQMLPASLVPAIAEGTYGYRPQTAAERQSGKLDQQHLRKVLDVDPSMADDLWDQNVAIALCQWASGVAILSSLPALLRNTPRLATELLPCIAHIVLSGEVDQDPVVRTELSNALSKHFADSSPSPGSRLRSLVRLLLYLRTQPWPGEATKADRVRWLEVDLSLAADASARCGMPTAALLFAESTTPVAQTVRRTSSRASLSQLQPVDVSNEILLSIFTQVDEPDSFYGVQQPASLESVLDTLDYESNGIKSLMFRSARMDSVMRVAHRTAASDAQGMTRSLSALNLHSLEHALLSGPLASSASSTEEMLKTARKLQQWDVASPEASSSPAAARFSVYQQLSRAISRNEAISNLHSLVIGHMQAEIASSTTGPPSVPWCSALASLTEAMDVVHSTSDSLLRSQWTIMQSRQHHMQGSHPEDAGEVATDRSILFSVLSHNTGLLKDMHISLRPFKVIEVESLLSVAQLARSNGNLQEALSAATQVSLLAKDAKDASGLTFSAASMLETASVLWEAGEAAASVKMLRDIMSAGDGERQDLPIGESGLLAGLARQLADARLEKPDAILEGCLRPAIKHLKNRNEGQEAGKVFYEFAAFCDRQLQHPGNLEDFYRIAKLREKKLADVQELEQIAKKSRKSTQDYKEANKATDKAQQWFEIDDAEYQRLKKNRDDFVQQSLQNYLLALHASDDHDICVLRFFAMWLENCGSPAANAVVHKHLGLVPSWKFVVLNNQLMSRLENDKSNFQALLKKLMQRICADHPHHSLHHLYSATRKPQSSDDTAARSRYEAASGIRIALQNNPQKADLVKTVFEADNEYNRFAYSSLDPLGNRDKVSTKQFAPAERLVNKIRSLKVPPATISVTLRPDGNYNDVPVVQSFGSTMSIMGGLSHPKVLTAFASDGKVYKQLFKGTKDDDLRQDAIMEQVFEEVSKMLRNHKATRQRNLQVRTYKVIPLTSQSGIMEWVPNSIPIGEWLKPAHLRYCPRSTKSSDAAVLIRKLEHDPEETRMKEFRKICDSMPPVMRHFFFERFDDPDEWFEKRTAYTRTTAAISILGHVLGLGDRHCQNILLDEKTGEAVHIDLGVAFEAGRVLPVPERVPFRLSRDIVDAMGITKTEGVFRRCCEFTMDALREDKDSIMTLLNVLRYDPLYNWTVSPLRAKRMQDAQEMTGNAVGNAEEASSRMKEQEAGEADRALSIVEKKLSKTLSTAATVNELIQQATDERNLATLFAGWSAFF